MSSDLQEAIRKGNKGKIKRLIKSGKCDPNGVDENGSVTPLHLALHEHQEEIVKKLVKYGVDVNKKSESETPLIKAVKMNCATDILQCLLEAGGDINDCDYRGWTALHHATYLGHEDTVKFLLRASCDRNRVSLENQTPLFLAAAKGRKNLIPLLLYLKPDPRYSIITCRGAEGSSKKHYKRRLAKVFSRRHRKSAQDYNGSQDSKTSGSEEGTSSSTSGDSDKTVLCDLDTADLCHFTALHIALENFNPSIAVLLVEAGANANLYNDLHVSPLYQAISCSYTAVVDAIAKTRCNLEVCALQRGRYGYPSTALQKGITQSHYTICQILIENGCRLNNKGTSGQTPIQMALYPFCALYMADLLIYHGAYMDTTDCHTALAIAIKRTDVDFIERLISASPYDASSFDFGKVSDCKDLSSMVQEHLKEAPSLMEVSRYVIRRQLTKATDGRTIVKNCEQLPLPRQLREYVALTWL